MFPAPMRRLSGAFFAAVLLTACGGSDTPSRPDPEPQPDPNEVGSSGGTVTAQNGAVTLAIPAGAVSSNVTVSITPASDPVSDPNTLPGTVYEFGPTGTQFAQPVTLTLDYDPSTVPGGIPPEAVTITRYVNGAWQPIGGTISVDVNAGKVSGQITSFSSYSVQADRCALRTLSLTVSGSISDADCVYSDATRTNWEELYRVDVAALAAAAGVTGSGTPRLNLRFESDFDHVIGFQEAAPGFEGLVYRFRQKDVDAGTAVSEFSIYPGDDEYKLFIGGDQQVNVGDWTLTITVEDGGVWDPNRDAGAIAGHATFTSSISEANSLQGEVTVGPFAGQPLFYQYRLARLEAGKSYRYAIKGLPAGSGSIGLFSGATPLSTRVDAELDLGGGEGDTDRENLFVASRSGFYYLEVSGPPGLNATYTLTLEEVAGYDPCAARPLQPVRTATINAADCVYSEGGAFRYQDIYSVSPAVFAAAQGVPAGPVLIDFTADASFEGIMGLKQPASVGDLVYGFRRFQPNQTDRMYVLADGGEFDLFFSGWEGDDLGSYTLRASAQPIGDYVCGTGYLATAITFSATLRDANGCAGTIQFGPNAGLPLVYQYWYAKLESGKSYTIEATGITNPTTALFVSNRDFTTEQTLDVGEGVGDGTRSVTFTPAMTTYYYFEVSKAPGGDAPYSFSFREGS